jgi:hypothetical protein
MSFCNAIYHRDASRVEYAGTLIGPLNRYHNRRENRNENCHHGDGTNNNQKCIPACSLRRR